MLKLLGKPKNAKLKIGIIVPSFPVYSETFFISQVIGLCKRGHKVFVFCNVHNRDKSLFSAYDFSFSKNIKILELSKRSLVVNGVKSLCTQPFKTYKWFKIYHKISECLNCLYFRRFKCDVYHFGFSGVAIRYNYLFNYLPGKIMISCLGTGENVLTVTRKDRLHKLKTVFKKADSVHCISNAMQRKVLCIYPVATFVNQPAVDTTFFTSESNSKNIGRIKILSVGRLVFQKGFGIGFLAICELIKQFKNFEWTIVGEGKDFEELLFYRQIMKLEKHVFLVGKKDRLQLKEIYKEADIFFLPSISEGIANVVLEAMAMKLAVLVSDCGGMKEIIDQGKNGYLVESFNYSDMAKLLFLLCNKEEIRNKLGKESRKTIVEKFSLTRYIDVFESNYFEIAQKVDNNRVS